MGERHPEGIGVLQVVETSASRPPDEAARKVFSQALDVCDKYVKHHSVVHEGSGFKAASVRAIVMGVYMVHQPKLRVSNRAQRETDRTDAWWRKNRPAAPDLFLRELVYESSLPRKYASCSVYQAWIAL